MIKDRLHNGIFKATLIYTLSDGFCKALSFVMLPLVSYYLIPSQLGIAANFEVLLSIIMLLAGQAIVNSLPYFYYNRSKNEVRNIVSSLIYIIIFFNIVFFGLVLIFTNSIYSYLHIGLALQLLTILTCISQLLCNINFILYRLENKPFLFAKLQIVQSIIYILLILLLVVEWRMGAVGKILCSVLTFSLMALLHIYLMARRKLIIFSVNKVIIKELLKFGIPLLPHALSFWIKSGMDKILLTAFCGLTVNGLYSMALSFGGIYTIFNNAFSNAYIPYLQSRINKMTPEKANSEKIEFVKLTYCIGLLFCALSLMIVIICKLLINYVLDPKYLPSFQFIPWIIFSLTIYSFYGLVIQYPYTVKKTFGLGIITFGSSLVQLFFSYILLYSFGSNGIKYSLIIGSLFTMFGVWWYSNKVYPLPWFSWYKK